MRVHARSLATELCITGEVDVSNVDLVAEAMHRYSQLKAPLIIDLGHVDFLGAAGFRALLAVNHEHRQAQWHCSVVAGAAMRRFTGVFPDHGLLIANSIPEALHRVDSAIRARRRLLSGLARQREPQRRTPPVR